MVVRSKVSHYSDSLVSRNRALRNLECAIAPYKSRASASTITVIPSFCNGVHQN
ncbi:hypothetical protein [Dasychira pudibunda nucleopolyhedrovirus]|nr:hypothetical protein [Dasychira pudibunda nucleopolyhedrovirus]WHM28355.1 hypothetical protein [Dasychira pudibunda nucleopolyhedrovirus]